MERILRPPQGQGADAALRYDATWLLNLPTPDESEELTCLAHALYFEARGEGVRGQYAVAEVILNRMDSPQFPDTICGVVYQGGGGGCQFSFTCDGNPESIHERGAYDLALRIARLMKDGAVRELTEGATHFHTTAVRPSWSRRFPRTADIGLHRFYRAPIRLSAN